MRKKWLWGLLLLLAAGGVAAYAGRDAIALRLITSAAEKAMARNVLASLDAQALHVGFCGTGSPLPTRNRAAGCTVVIADGRLFVFDMGDGSGKNLMAMGLPADRIEGVWLTHLHSDHFEGLGPYALQRWAGSSATTPLPVFGPDGVAEITEGLNRAYKIDSGYRIAHHGADIVPPSGFGFSGTVVAPGVVYDKAGVRITAFTVNHAPIAPAYGYRIDYNGRSVTITGDTALTPSLAEAAKGSDLLVSEMLSPRLVKILENAARKAEQPNRAKIFADIQNYHITPEQAADVAKDAGVGMLAFTHIVPSVPKMMQGALLGNASAHYSGPMRVLQDGDLISISGKGTFETRNILP